MTLEVADDLLRMRVDDDGRGVASIADGGTWPRYGLQSMRDRATGLGGSLELQPLAHGTRVELLVPLAHARLLA